MMAKTEVKKTIRESDSVANLNKIVVQINNDPYMNVSELTEFRNTAKEQLELALTTGYDALIVAWRDLFESLDKQLKERVS